MAAAAAAPATAIAAWAPSAKLLKLLVAIAGIYFF